MNDLLEEIVGDLENEENAEVKEPDIKQINENEWTIQGCASLDDVERNLKIQLPIDEYETFSGYVFSAFTVRYRRIIPHFLLKPISL